MSKFNDIDAVTKEEIEVLLENTLEEMEDACDSLEVDERIAAYKFFATNLLAKVDELEKELEEEEG